MVSYDQEIRASQKKMIVEEKSKEIRIVEDLKKRFNLDFKNKSNINIIIEVLTNPRYLLCRSTLITLLRAYDYSEKALISYLVSYYSQANTIQRKVLEVTYKHLPYFHELKKEDGHLTWVTDYGTLEFYPFSEHFSLREKQFYKENFKGKERSHHAVEFYKNYYKNLYITTVEVERLFKTPTFHSVLASKNNKTVFDIAHNTIYFNNSYFKVYSPNEISKIQSEEVYDEFAKLATKKKSNFLSNERILKLALEPQNIHKINALNLQEK